MIARPPTIEMRNVTRRFGRLRAVDDLSFTVGEGEVVGFIGPNGAGKTTSMRILATLDLPNEGDAFVDGFSVIDDPDRVRRRLGFMPDNYGAYSHMNCEEYLDFFARAYGLIGKARIAAMQRVIEFTHLGPLAQKSIRSLSKGMKQRLCLGRALIHDPQVIVLDEPAAGLDPRARIELREMITQLAQQGKSVLISSHILTELAEMCQRVVIIELGRLLAVGTVDEIMTMGGAQGDRQDSLIDVVMRVVDSLDEAVQWLRNNNDVQEVVADNGIIRFQTKNESEFQAELLRKMVQSGIRVCSFVSRQKSLEEVFVKVTEGRVQ
jgi:ABC-2 type transport system ATP-binding protein